MRLALSVGDAAMGLLLLGVMAAFAALPAIAVLRMLRVL